ncbi:hypothetical protein NLU13_6446 [Sarocladium strictum]|uniref:DUF2470 domain-containing protein n=1 Tax=Sarocladium strictum TaxID=5046 RepID=A0AA39L6Q6_SARSR|nr:hypothetical protein NLU13_6446 [Sarocladium strictum]
MATSTDAERVNRIIKHMNSQHRLELSHYLRHHHSLSSRAASPALLTSLTLTSMTITDRNGKAYTVPIDPPLATWADARTRLADMDTEARKHLGLSDVTLDTYKPPSSFTEVLVFSSVAAFFFCYATLPYVTPGTKVYSLLDQFWPRNGAESYIRLVKFIFLPVLGTHILEMALLDIKRLQPYGVERFSKLWWTWQISCFIEGFSTFKRTKAIVNAKRAEKEKASKGH